MGFLSPISAGMAHDAADGRRVFCHGLLLTKRRVFVGPEEERRLRRVYEWGVAGTLLVTMLTGVVTPLWFRLFVMVPMAVAALELVLRQMTRRLPSAPVILLSKEPARENGRR